MLKNSQNIAWTSRNFFPPGGNSVHSCVMVHGTYLNRWNGTGSQFRIWHYVIVFCIPYVGIYDTQHDSGVQGRIQKRGWRGTLDATCKLRHVIQLYVRLAAIDVLQNIMVAFRHNEQLYQQSKVNRKSIYKSKFMDFLMGWKRQLTEPSIAKVLVLKFSTLAARISNQMKFIIYGFYQNFKLQKLFLINFNNVNKN